jgi:hypothetical protein
MKSVSDIPGTERSGIYGSPSAKLIYEERVQWFG